MCNSYILLPHFHVLCCDTSSVIRSLYAGVRAPAGLPSTFQTNKFPYVNRAKKKQRGGYCMLLEPNFGYTLLYRGRIPSITSDPHQVRLLVGKADFAFLVKSDLFAVFLQPDTY